MPRSASSPKCTDAELLLLGLIAEMPRHGYQLEQEIDRRGMREWTQIGFSSIYFVLGKLKKMRLISATKQANPRAKKTFKLTALGRRTLIVQTLAALRTYRPTYSSVLLGMINWSVLTRDQALEALEARLSAVDAELTRVETIQAERQPLPDYIEAMFDFTISQLNAESEWIARTLEYMQTKPWLEEH